MSYGALSAAAVRALSKGAGKAGIWMNYEVNVLAHSCRLSDAREFKREYVRIVQSPGVSLPLDVILPYRAVTKSA